MVVHFICRGNVYRSRLGESLLKSKQFAEVDVISSGIEASNNLSGIISWYAQRLTQKNHLIDFEKQNWQQTTQELLDKSDLIIFLSPDIYNYCREKFNLDNKKFETWEIEDLVKIFDVNEVISKTEKTFEDIKKRVEELSVRLPQ